MGGRGGIVTFPHYNEKKRRIPEPVVRLTSIKMNNLSEIGVDNQEKNKTVPSREECGIVFFQLLII